MEGNGEFGLIYIKTLLSTKTFHLWIHFLLNQDPLYFYLPFWCLLSLSSKQSGSSLHCQTQGKLIEAISPPPLLPPLCVHVCMCVRVLRMESKAFCICSREFLTGLHPAHKHHFRNEFLRARTWYCVFFPSSTRLKILQKGIALSDV